MNLNFYIDKLKEGKKITISCIDYDASLIYRDGGFLYSVEDECNDPSWHKCGEDVIRGYLNKGFGNPERFGVFIEA